MTKILSDQKLSVWQALDRSLVEYYQLLVDRQNLIEETGLLNQQNEELKTLLNQYLQAGVNQELQVPPTQVIRLDIWETIKLGWGPSSLLTYWSFVKVDKEFDSI